MNCEEATQGTSSRIAHSDVPSTQARARALPAWPCSPPQTPLRSGSAGQRPGPTPGWHRETPARQTLGSEPQGCPQASGGLPRVSTRLQPWGGWGRLQLRPWRALLSKDKLPSVKPPAHQFPP